MRHPRSEALRSASWKRGDGSAYKTPRKEVFILSLSHVAQPFRSPRTQPHDGQRQVPVLLLSKLFPILPIEGRSRSMIHCVIIARATHGMRELVPTAVFASFSGALITRTN